MKAPDQGPSGAAWCVAALSLVLPWIGLAFCFAGVLRAYDGAALGWWLLVAGAAMIVLDLAIDFVWANPSFSRSDEPDLNRRGAQCIGRICTVEEAIVAGRGKVRIGDTVWPAEGADAGAGAQVRVTGSQGTVLSVEPIALSTYE